MSGVCVISARGGSKGLPNKNIRMLMGKPLIAWTIIQAQKVSEIEKVVVSTDSEEISSIARKFGAETPFIRPSNLASDNSGKFQVFKHAFKSCVEHYKKDFDFFLDLDCTNPLRDVSDITSAINLFKDLRSSGVDGVFSVCDARKNPYFNLVEPDEKGFLKISKKINNSLIVRRQDAPLVFEHVASIYVLSPEYLMNSDNLLDGNLRGYNIGQDKSFDVDSELDFKIIEFLMSNKKNQI
ncbi:acylneuraminate cytidylyltransferase family protein [Candidatus Pelagibacter sp.]|uniref:acylneuraminate cytidylyltransferase family protein n=1 Tax=Candidatus Pelagibacter sp. TaxID=2024849 RepID=UPI003F845075